MKRRNLALLTSIVLLGVMSSCASTVLADKDLTRSELATTDVLGTVEINFISFHFFYVRNNEKIKNKAYERLLAAARTKYGSDVDVRNIRIKTEFTPLGLINTLGGLGAGLLIGYPVGQAMAVAVGEGSTAAIVGYTTYISFATLVMTAAGETKRMVATADVVVYNSDKKSNANSNVNSNVVSPNIIINSGTLAAPSTVPSAEPVAPSAAPSAAPVVAPSLQITEELEFAINNISQSLQQQLPSGSTIAVLSMSTTSQDTSLSAFILDELEFQMVNAKKFKVVDRKTVNQIKQEQQFQLSGDVDDEAAVSIGKMLGATIVITGTISTIGSKQRIITKALDVQTAEIISMFREEF
ncbi:MAG: penicillin-binding protein activator LpoB [Spirochaetaceae bacterium]|jgi:TolB-like protein|nr:penicillin-binding protein activator LpoB [Spirochaetaceae bacterium]